MVVVCLIVFVGSARGVILGRFQTVVVVSTFGPNPSIHSVAVLPTFAVIVTPGTGVTQSLVSVSYNES